jgi:hypothetical protein
MRRRGWSALDFAVVIGVLALILVVVLQTRRVLWSWHVDTAHAAVKELADAHRESALIRSRTVEIAGRLVKLQVVTRDGRNVIELVDLPCHVARGLDAKIDDGDFSRGDVRASAASCTIGGDNDPVPTVAVALPG